MDGWMVTSSHGRKIPITGVQVTGKINKKSQVELKVATAAFTKNEQLPSFSILLQTLQSPNFLTHAVLNMS